jgi:hypothetical protein
VAGISSSGGASADGFASSAGMFSGGLSLNINADKADAAAAAASFSWPSSVGALNAEPSPQKMKYENIKI